MQNAWKEAARMLRRKCEVMQIQLDWIREGDAAMRDERLDEPFDDWEMAARHWHAKMREAEREQDELLQKIEELRAQPSSNPGEFADLAKRIAEADAKHPRDSPDGDIHDEEWWLDNARAKLKERPCWANALSCEVHEAEFELARGNASRFADELLDVATVAMRWRRAVLERKEASATRVDEVTK